MKMIKSVLVSLAVVLGAFFAQGAIEEVDGIKWWYKTCDGGVEITSGSDAAAIDTATSGDVTVPSVLGGLPVVAIGDYAFCRCTQLSNVVIRSGVKRIGNRSFYDCTGLRMMTVPDSVTEIGPYAFYSCESLMSFTAKGAVEVSIDAFAYSSLQTVDLPRVEIVGTGAFCGCSKLTSVSMPKVRILEGGAFRSCSSLRALSLPSIESLGQFALEGCSSLETVSLSEKIRHVYNDAFQGTALLGGFSENSLKLVDGKVVLGWQGSCPNKVTIPNGVKVIAVAAFADCRNLDSVTLPEGLVTIEGSAFTGTSLLKLSLPSTVSEIGAYAFYNCAGIAGVALPDSTRIVGDSAFMGCDAIASVAFENGVESIGWDSFRGCTRMKNVSLPATVTNIGHRAFADCSGLLDVQIHMNGVDLHFGNEVFSGCSSLKAIRFWGQTSCIHVYQWGATPFGTCSSLEELTFDGNAPKFAPTVNGNYDYSYSTYFYSGLPNTMTTYVPYGSTGWSSETSSRLPSTWCGRAIAHYGTPQTHTVTFDPQWSGASVTNVAYLDDEEVRAPDVPSRTGWSFRGWYDDPADGNYVTYGGGSFYPGGDMTLYAHWERSGGGDDIEDSLCYAYDRKTGYTWSFLPDEDTGTASLIGVEPVPEGVLTIPSTVKDNDSGLSYTVVSLGYDNFGGSGCICCGSSSSYFSDFQCLYGITSLVIPSSVTSIGRESFRGCAALASLTIPSSVTYLGSGAFAETGLKDVTIPATVKIFDLRAFDACSQLESLSVAAETISSDCSLSLCDCPNLKTLNLPNAVHGVDSEEDWYEIWLEGLSSLEFLIVPEGVTDFYCFSFAELSAVCFPSTINWCLDCAFDGCWKLDKVVFAGDVPCARNDERSTVEIVAGILYYANSIYYPSAYAAHWEKIFRNSGYGGTYGVYAPKQAKTMAAMVAAAPAYATEEVPDIGPFVVTVSAQQTIQGAQGLSMSNVPAGLTWNSASGTLSGTAKVAGEYVVQVGGEDLTLRVDPSPDQEDQGEVVEIILGAKVDMDLKLVGYSVQNLPKGLTYTSRSGKLTGTAKTVTDAEGVVVTFQKKDAVNVEWTFVVRAEGAPTVACDGLTESALTVGVFGDAAGIPLALGAESGIKSVTATKLPTGMKLASSKDKKSWYITGAPTKAGTYEVSIALTTAAGNKVTEKFTVSVAALSSGATGTFNGFVQKAGAGEGETLNAGSLQVTVSDVGKITAKVVAAAGTYSFTATGWDSVNEGVYSVEMTTKKGDVLTLVCDANAAWNAKQMTGTFTAGGAVGGGTPTLPLEAQKNAFGKLWFFNAAPAAREDTRSTGDDADSWVLSFAENAKAAALTVTLNADGKTSIAGKLGSYKITASGYADVSGIGSGAIFADFAPVVTVGKTKKVLSLRANLWFDRKNDHAEGVGSAVFAE